MNSNSKREKNHDCVHEKETECITKIYNWVEEWEGIAFSSYSIYSTHAYILKDCEGWNPISPRSRWQPCPWWKWIWVDRTNQLGVALTLKLFRPCDVNLLKCSLLSTLSCILPYQYVGDNDNQNNYLYVTFVT